MTGRKAHQRHYEARLAWWEQYKASCRCFICGAAPTEAQQLHFHHPLPDRKHMKLTRLVHGGYSMARIKEELNWTIPVCELCHGQLHGTAPKAIRGTLPILDPELNMRTAILMMEVSSL